MEHDPNLTEIQCENRRKLSPMLELVYGMAQSANAHHIEEEALKDAEDVRSDAGRIQTTGNVGCRCQDEGCPNLQLEEEKQEASGDEKG